MTPFALAQNGLGQLFNSEIGKSIRVRSEGLATDEQRAFVADRLGECYKLLVRQTLRGDIDKVRLRENLSLSNESRWADTRSP